MSRLRLVGGLHLKGVIVERCWSPRQVWRDGGESAAQWQASLEAYGMPQLVSKPTDRITTADVMAVLMSIWNEKRETAPDVCGNA